jgi:hypothetical protein
MYNLGGFVLHRMVIVMKTIYTRLFPVLLLVAVNIDANAEEVDFGIGLSFVSMGSEYGLDSGFDAQLGYEVVRRGPLNMGAQLHLTRSLSTQSDEYAEGDLNYSSTGLYLTARPHNWWLQFKAGAVKADYATFDRDESRWGYGLGAGIVMDYTGVKVHLLDYQHFAFGKDSFDAYTISFIVLQ